MREGSGTFRLARALAAGAFAALRWLAVLLVMIVVAVPLLRMGANWYVRGSVELSPPPDESHAGDMRLLAVRGGTRSEASAVRSAVGGLRYRLDPAALSVVIVDDGGPGGVESEAEYLPYLGLIRLNRRAMSRGRALLQWTLAHEIGHSVDQSHMTDAARRRYSEMRGIPADAGWQGIGLPWRERPEEDFAEVFAALAVPSPVTPIGTAYGPVRDPGRFEELLGSVGVTFGETQPPTGWREAIEREYRLVVDTFADPAIVWPAAVLIGAYLLLGALPPAIAEWRRPDRGEGVPAADERRFLDRKPRRILNTRRTVSHTVRSAHVTRQGRRHGSGR